MPHPSQRRASGAHGGSLARRPYWFLAQLLVIALAALTPAFVSASPASSTPTAPSAGTRSPPCLPASSTTVPAARYFFIWKYNDSATVGFDKGCSTSNNVTRATKPDLIANLLHVSCSDTISSDGVPTKSDLGDPARRVASYVIQKSSGKICGMGNPAEDPKTDIEIVKTASKVTVTSGEEITYTLKVKNVGNTSAHHVIVSDVLPDGTTFVSASAGCTYDSGTRKVTCDAGDLPFASSATGSCTRQGDYYKWEYNDSATVGIDEGCSTTNNVTRAINPNLVATLLHVSCSDTISSGRRPDQERPGRPGPSGEGLLHQEVGREDLWTGHVLAARAEAVHDQGEGHQVALQHRDRHHDRDRRRPEQQPQHRVRDGPREGLPGDLQERRQRHHWPLVAFVVEGKTYNVPAGACSAAIKVSSGTVTVKEKWIAGYSMVGASTVPTNRLISVDKANRTIKVDVVAGDVNKQTVLTVTNKAIPGTLKVCEVAGAGVAEGTMFSFTNSASTKTISVPAGPAPGGYCAVFPGTYTGKVTVTQAAKTGHPVSDIAVGPSDRFVSRNLAARTAEVRIAGGVTEVTYTNVKTG